MIRFKKRASILFLFLTTALLVNGGGATNKKLPQTLLGPKVSKKKVIEAIHNSPLTIQPKTGKYDKHHTSLLMNIIYH